MTVIDMIEEIRENVQMEVRPNSEGQEYLEAVITKSSLDLLQPVLQRHLGPARKAPGEEVCFSEEIQDLVDALGGLRTDQSFFYRQEDSRVLFAALWPWKSNPNRITLKAGWASVEPVS